MKVKIKGAPAAVQSLLSGSSGANGVGAGSLREKGNFETPQKVQQEQDGRNRPSKGALLVKRQSSPVAPIKTGVLKAAGPATPASASRQRANSPNDNGRRDGAAYNASKSLLSGSRVPPALSPVNATGPELKYLRAQQPQSGE